MPKNIKLIQLLAVIHESQQKILDDLQNPPTSSSHKNSYRAVMGFEDLIESQLAAISVYLKMVGNEEYDCISSNKNRVLIEHLCKSAPEISDDELELKYGNNFSVVGNRNFKS